MRRRLQSVYIIDSMETAYAMGKGMAHMYYFKRLVLLAFLLVLPFTLAACEDDASLKVEEGSIEDAF